VSETGPAARLSDLRPGIARLAGLVPGTVDEQIALSDAELRKGVAERIVRAFITVNSTVLAIVAAAFIADCLMVSDGTIGARDRIVSTNVLLALISAATVQLGGIAIIMGKYLFPAKT
jgi:hypothetical protein